MDMLSQIYPVHVLEYMSSLGTDHHSPDHTAIGQLARRHEQVTILFMDIVGEPRRRAWRMLPWCLQRPLHPHLVPPGDFLPLQHGNTGTHPCVSFLSFGQTLAMP